MTYCLRHMKYNHVYYNYTYVCVYIKIDDILFTPSFPLTYLSSNNTLRL